MPRRRSWFRDIRSCRIYSRSGGKKHFARVQLHLEIDFGSARSGNGPVLLQSRLKRSRKIFLWEIPWPCSFPHPPCLSRQSYASTRAPLKAHGHEVFSRAGFGIRGKQPAFLCRNFELIRIGNRRGSPIIRLAARVGKSCGFVFRFGRGNTIEISQV